jgi:hypothetical protein
MNFTTKSFNYLNPSAILAIFILMPLVVACKAKETKPPQFNSQKQGAKGKTGTEKKTTDDAEQNSTDNEAFLSTSDFSSENSSIPRAEFQRVIQDLRQAFVNKPSKGNEPGNIDDCTKKMREPNVKVTKSSIESSSEIDDCGTTHDGRKITLNFKGKLIKHCKEDGFSTLVDKPERDILSKDLSSYCKSSEVNDLLNVKMEFENQDSSGQTLTKSAMRIARMKKDGGPCIIKTTDSKSSIEDGCIFYSQETKTYTTRGVKDITFKGSYKDTEATFNSEFFTKGSVDFTLNNWSGTVSFGPNGPAYEAKSQNGDTLKGKIQ